MALGSSGRLGDDDGGVWSPGSCALQTWRVVAPKLCRGLFSCGWVVRWVHGWRWHGALEWTKFYQMSTGFGFRHGNRLILIDFGWFWHSLTWGLHQTLWKQLSEVNLPKLQAVKCISWSCKCILATPSLCLLPPITLALRGQVEVNKNWDESNDENDWEWCSMMIGDDWCFSGLCDFQSHPSNPVCEV